MSKIVYKNHFLLSDDTESVLRGKKQGVSFFNVASSHPEKFDGMEGVTVFKRVNKPEDACFGALALMDLTDDKIVDAVSEAVLGNGAKLIAAAGYSLDETGLIDVKFHLSPVQYLHKLGLLEKCTVVGGVYLDREDVDLMAQCGTSLILCPTCSMGYGFGIPHFKAYCKKLKVYFGSGDNRFNRNGCMLAEARTMYLGSNSDMRSDCSVDLETLFACFSSHTPPDAEQLLFS